MKRTAFPTLTALLLAAVAAGLAMIARADNTLTADEQAAGWHLLFDGQSLKGWRPYGKPGTGADAIGSGWTVADGVLKKLAGAKGGDIIAEKQYTDFELAWEWRLEKDANNGVKYLVTEARPKAPGHEYQMIDDHSDKWKKLRAKSSTASFYEVLPPVGDKPLKPVGEWNASRIVVQGNQVEHWLNGKRVLAYELGSAAVKVGVAASKFNKYPDFGTKLTGHIMLTDHKSEAWYRNIKLRELSAPPVPAPAAGTPKE